MEGKTQVLMSGDKSGLEMMDYPRAAGTEAQMKLRKQEAVRERILRKRGELTR